MTEPPVESTAPISATDSSFQFPVVDADLHDASSTRQTPNSVVMRAALLFCSALALAAMLVALRLTAGSVLTYILDPRDDSLFQEARPGMPVPQILNWNQNLIDLLIFLRTLPAALLLLAVCVIALGGAWASAAALSCKAKRAGESEKLNEQRSAGRSMPLPWAVAAVILAAIARWCVPAPMNQALMVIHTLGTFNRLYFTEIAGTFLMDWFAAGIAVGAILIGICAPALRRSQRAALLAPAALLLLVNAAHRYTLSPARIARRIGLTPDLVMATPPFSPYHPTSGVPDGPRAGLVLARRTGIPAASLGAPGRNLLLFGQRSGSPVVLRQAPYTEDYLVPTSDSRQLAEQFLRARRYRTALSWTAIKHLFNVGAVHLDLTSELSACMLDMEKCPHLAQCASTTRAMLFTCAATRANKAMLDRWADERYFAFEDRDSLKMMGDLYVRFGDPARAMAWYRRAEMPQSFLHRVQSERPLFTSGTFSGRIRLNGKPLAGVRIGVVPTRMNGLPRDLEPIVLECWREVVSARYTRMMFRPFEPSPYALRWVTAAATTDRQGRFTVNHLTEGTYLPIVSLPINVHLHSPFDPRLHIAHPAAPFTVDYAAPTYHAAAVDIQCPVISNAESNRQENPFG
ncbi:MAG TPA: hypothetical protein VGS41_05705 [Chthonomonadales bacterium]|nr:hypothetical protein [Chthonomonadales bacterium]